MWPSLHTYDTPYKENHTQYKDYIHPRYLVSEITTVFPEIPVSLDFTAVVPRDAEIKPPKLYSLKTKKKRNMGIMDMKVIDEKRGERKRSEDRKQNLPEEKRTQSSVVVTNED